MTDASPAAVPFDESKIIYFKKKTKGKNDKCIIENSYPTVTNSNFFSEKKSNWKMPKYSREEKQKETGGRERMKKIENSLFISHQKLKKKKKSSLKRYKKSIVERVGN